MKQSQAKRRIPKEGCLFSGLRLAGLLSKILGGLTLLGGILGFVIAFVRSAPGLVDALQHFDQQMAKFVFTLIMVYLGVFAGLGCVGLIILGLGFLLDYISTKPNNVAIDKPLPAA